MDAFDKIREAARALALAAGDLKDQGVTIPLYESLRLAIDDAAGGDQPWPAERGQFELSAYELGITRHEVAAAALDRIMARDFSDTGERIVNVEAHARRCALEAWAYANSLFDLEHVTEEQPS